MIAMAELTITQQNFEQEVLLAKEPVLVDFWATWCGPCRMLAPVIEEIANEYAGKVKVGKVNVDDERELALEYGVSSIPTVMVFQNGEVKQTSVGYRPKEEIEQLLK
jgi:thioredoxin 1